MIKCGGYKTWTDCGYEYDCEYGAEFPCEDCILTGGIMSPISGKKFRGNRAPYEEQARTAAQQPKPETLKIDIKDLFKL